MGGLLTFPVPGTAGGGLFNRIAIIDDGQKKNVGKLHLFDNLPTTIADNAAISGLAAADLHNLLEVITVAAGDWVDVDAGSRADVTFDFTPYDAPRGNIYGYYELTAAAPTNPGGTDEVTFILNFLPREVY
jgi:hypothetical protein